jgi:hypothetical protein
MRAVESGFTMVRDGRKQVDGETDSPQTGNRREL